MAGTYYNAILRINSQAGNYTADITDFNSDTLTVMTSASANTYTIPPNVFPIGTQLLVTQDGAGQTTITAGSGVTINSPSGLKISAQYGTITAMQKTLNTWTVAGSLTV